MKNDERLKRVKGREKFVLRGCTEVTPDFLFRKNSNKIYHCSHFKARWVLKLMDLLLKFHKPWHNSRMQPSFSTQNAFSSLKNSTQIESVMKNSLTWHEHTLDVTYPQPHIWTSFFMFRTLHCDRTRLRGLLAAVFQGCDLGKKIFFVVRSIFFLLSFFLLCWLSAVL